MTRSLFTILQSNQDASVNWVRPMSVGCQEARYVRRVGRYFIVYLSSQSGCAQGCRMCHLTATRQTRFVNTTVDDFAAQADIALGWYRELANPAEVVHFNFMARGEPLSNPVMLDHSREVLLTLGDRALGMGLRPRFLISTIMPKSIRGRALADVFPLVQPELYYSIYSIDDVFRRRWLPAAMPVNAALHQMREWQRFSSKVIKIHYAFIAGENDALKDVTRVCDAVKDHRLLVNVNIVRFNPPPGSDARESSESVVERNAMAFREHLPGARVKVVPRVGPDVHASCGMFVG